MTIDKYTLTSLNMENTLESPANLVKLIGLICAKYGLDPTQQTNLTNIKAFLGPLRVDSIAAQAGSVDKANAMIVDLFGSRMKDPRLRGDLPSDMNRTTQYLLKLIKTPGDDQALTPNNATAAPASSTPAKVTSSLLAMTPTERFETIRYLNYSSLFRDEYVLIDSRYQNKVNTDPTKMIFSLLSNTKSKTDHGGVIVGNRIQDIVEIEVYSFTIPYKPVYVTFYNKITLTVNEWASNSFEAYEGGQFHFCFDVQQVDNNLIYLSPINPTYSFSKPVNYIDSFSLSFGAVFPKISFDADRMVPRSFSYSNPLGLVTFDSNHGLVTGDLVYITGFETPDLARDSVVIADVNRPEGHTIVKRDKTSFLINVDLTVAHHEEPPDSGYFPIDNFLQASAVVFFASKRVQIQMRLRYLTSYS
jgi:hypothetical protein